MTFEPIHNPSHQFLIIHLNNQQTLFKFRALKTKITRSVSPTVSVNHFSKDAAQPDVRDVKEEHSGFHFLINRVVPSPVGDLGSP